MQFLRCLLFSLFMATTTVLTALLSLPLILVPLVPRVRLIRLYGVANVWMLKVLCGVKYQIEGTENIPPGPALIFSKHQSTWETMALQMVFPPQTFVIKRELLWVPFFGWGLATMRPIAIDRRAGRRAIEQIVEQGIDRLNRGLWIVIFPEGTRVPPGKRIRYKLGGAILAARSGRPVVPVAHNAGEFWRKGQFVKKPGTIRMVIGPPIPTAGRKPEAILADAENWIEATMDRISHPLPQDPD
jgi:1-acyl-sn-glycerol-3-phosphate acyltransferase